MKKILTLLLLATLLLTACNTPAAPIDSETNETTVAPTDAESTTPVENETTTVPDNTDTTIPNGTDVEPDNMERLPEINADNISKISISMNDGAYIYTVERSEIEQIHGFVDQIQGNSLGKIDTAEYPQYHELFKILFYDEEKCTDRITVLDQTHCAYLGSEGVYKDYEMMQTDMLGDLISYCNALVELYLASIEAPAIHTWTVEQIEICRHTYPAETIRFSSREDIERLCDALSPITGEVIGSTFGYYGPYITISIYDYHLDLRTKLTIWENNRYELDVPYPYDPDYNIRLQADCDLQPLIDVCNWMLERYGEEETYYIEG